MAKKKKSYPKGLFKKCPKCERSIYNKELKGSLWICPKCDYYFRLSARKRIKIFVDEGSFKEYDSHIMTSDPLKFKDIKPYKEKAAASREKSGLSEAVVSGTAKLGGHDISLCVLDFYFMGGSMGSVVGEKICRAGERAIEKRIPLIIISASGGARMQEGIISLMQMAKTSAVIAKLDKEKIPYFSIMCDPTSGGVSASFAMLGDVNIAEPRALIAFAGPRVIKQTIKQKLPPGFQSAEFVREHGMLDMIVEREDMRPELIKLLGLFTGKKPGSS
ncbi:MAG: acetyl-CoA carboxylase, carboxyltransferase subunit beta [Elusimicrobiota bacterium]